MPQNAPPTLVTARLTLRAHDTADFAESAAMWADERVTRFIGGRPSTAEEAWQRLLRYGGLWALLGFGYWVVRERGSDAFVGEIGFGNFHRDLDPPFGDTPEIGWALSPRAQGQGFAGEAVQAAVAWADAQRFDRTVCLISPDNAPSIRVAERAGYRNYARTDFKGSPTMLFERPVERRADQPSPAFSR